MINNFSYDAHFNRTTTRDAKGTPTTNIRNRYGLTEISYDALGRATDYEYDNNNPNLKRNNLTKITDARGKITTYAYDNFNNVLTITNHLGDTTAYTLS